MTAPVLDLELAHVTQVFEMHSTVGVLWDTAHMRYEPKSPPIINGPAMLCGYWGGTKAQAAFACVEWIELPTNVLKG